MDDHGSGCGGRSSGTGERDGFLWIFLSIQKILFVSRLFVCLFVCFLFSVSLENSNKCEKKI